MASSQKHISSLSFSSFRTLFHFLNTPSSQPISTEDFCTALQHVEPLLLLGLDLYGPPCKTSHHIISSGAPFTWRGRDCVVNDDAQKDFVFQISQALYLDEIESFGVLWSYLDVNYLHSSFAYDQDQLNCIVDFYFCERLYLLASLSTLFHRDDDATSPMLDALVAKDILSNFLSCYKEIAFSPRIPDRFRDSSAWADQNMQEQVSLLELFFVLFYSRVPCPPSLWLELFEVFEAQHYGCRQKLGGLFTPTGEQALATSSHLSVLILLETMHLENLISEHLSRASFPLLDNQPLALSLHKKMEGLGTRSEHGVVLLAWTCMASQYVNFLDSNLEEKEKQKDIYETFKGFHQLGTLALSLNPFDYLFSMLETTPNDHPNATSTRSILKGLIHSLLYSFDVTKFPCYEILEKVYSQIFTHQPHLCSHFWEHSFSSDPLRTFLDTAARNFPGKSFTLLKLLESLAGTPSWAETVVLYLRHCSFFTIPMSSEFCIVDSHRCKVIRNVEVWGVPLSSGTIGMVDSSSLQVQFCFNYSAWRMFSFVLEQLRRTSIEPLLLTALSAWCDLLAELISNDPKIIDSLKGEFPQGDIIDILVQTFIHLASLSQPDFSSLRALLSLLDQVSATHPGKLYSALQHHPTGDFIHSIRTLNLLLEAPRSQYPLTTSALRIVSRVILSDSSNDTSSDSSRFLEWVWGDLLSHIDFWRFQNPIDKFSLQCVLFELIDGLFTDIENSDPKQKVRSALATEFLRNLISSSFFHQKILNLLTLATPQTIELFFSQGKNKAGMYLESLMTVSFRIALKILRWERVNFSNSVRQSLSQYLLTSSALYKRSVDILDVITSYLDFHYQPEVPVLIITILTELAVAPTPPHARPLSLVAHLSSDTTVFCDRILVHLQCRSPKPLTTAIFQFLKASVTTQPALTEILFNIAKDDHKEGTFSATKIVNSVLQGYDIHFKHNPEFICGALSILAHIWTTTTELLYITNFFRAQSHFWKTLLDILTHTEGDIKARGFCKALVLSILANEIFFVPTKGALDSNLTEGLKTLDWEKVVGECLRHGKHESDPLQDISFIALPFSMVERNTLKELFEKVKIPVECIIRHGGDDHYAMPAYDVVTSPIVGTEKDVKKLQHFLTLHVIAQEFLKTLSDFFHILTKRQPSLFFIPSSIKRNIWLAALQIITDFDPHTDINPGFLSQAASLVVTLFQKENEQDFRVPIIQATSHCLEIVLYKPSSELERTICLLLLVSHRLLATSNLLSLSPLIPLLCQLFDSDTSSQRREQQPHSFLRLQSLAASTLHLLFTKLLEKEDYLIQTYFIASSFTTNLITELGSAFSSLTPPVSSHPTFSPSTSPPPSELVKYIETLLQLILSLSAHPSLAEELSVHGLVSTVLVSLPGFDLLDSKPIHTSWCLILAILDSLQQTLGFSSKSRSELLNFLAFHYQKLSTAFLFRPGGSDFTPIKARELFLITSVLYQVVSNDRTTLPLDPGNLSLFRDFHQKNVFLSLHMILFFLNPTLISPDGSDNSETKTTILSILSNIFAFLRTLLPPLASLFDDTTTISDLKNFSSQDLPVFLRRWFDEMVPYFHGTSAAFLPFLEPTSDGRLGQNPTLGLYLKCINLCLSNLTELFNRQRNQQSINNPHLSLLLYVIENGAVLVFMHLLYYFSHAPSRTLDEIISELDSFLSRLLRELRRHRTLFPKLQKKILQTLDFIEWLCKLNELLIQ